MDKAENQRDIPIEVITSEQVTGNLLEWIKDNHKNLMDKLYSYGGVLFRNANCHTTQEFNEIALAVSPNLLDYVYRSTPRTRVEGKIYTSTEYPKEQSIPLHNENAYSRNWPNIIMFFSEIVATTGGQTPIGDMRKVYERIPKTVRDKFIEKQILYVRNYQPGIDISWQDVFQTDDKSEVENYCKANEIKFEWRDSDSLRTKQVCQAVVNHPVTQVPVWFNQAHLFHHTSHPKEMQEALLEVYAEEDLPRNTYYGDGEPIDPEILECIRQAYEVEKRMFDWQQGDVMILDNVLISHAREPFTGDRKVVVAMA